MADRGRYPEGDLKQAEGERGSGQLGREASEVPEGSELKLITRGVLANSPWKIFVSFKTVIAASFATGAYALIFPTIWQLGDSFGWTRLVGLMIAAIFALIFWMIIGHDLWERSSDEADMDSRITATMQNVVTLLTLTMAVLISYTVLFLLLFLSAWIFISNGILEDSLGHAISLDDYATLAWVAASISTITGALGSGLEDDAAMRDAVNFR